MIALDMNGVSWKMGKILPYYQIKELTDQASRYNSMKIDYTIRMRGFRKELE